MKLIVPISSFLLAMVVYFMTGIYAGIHTTISYLFSIDAVQDQWRSKLVSLNEGLSGWIIMIALVSTALAVVSITNKFCSRIIGMIVLIISILSVLLSLLTRFM